MIQMLEPMLSEIREEAVTTKRVLERVPADKLSWKPHPKSMSLGQLASQASFEPPVPGDLKQIHAALDQSVRSAEECISGMSETAALGTWRLTLRGKEFFSKSRSGLLRSIMLNHWYHHRGQLSVYLRLLDVPVPAIYGRSADENPFA